MNSFGLFVIGLMLAIAVACHCFVRGFWRASVLSALLSGVTLGFLTHGLATTLSAFFLFVLASSAFLLVPAFVIGIPFQHSKKHQAYRARYDASPAGQWKRLVIGIVAIVLGAVVGVSVIHEWLSGTARQFPMKPLLGGLASIGLGVWQLVAAVIERKAQRRRASSELSRASMPA